MKFDKILKKLTSKSQSKNSKERLLATLLFLLLLEEVSAADDSDIAKTVVVIVFFAIAGLCLVGCMLLLACNMGEPDSNVNEIAQENTPILDGETNKSEDTTKVNKDASSNESDEQGFSPSSSASDTQDSDDNKLQFRMEDV